MNSPVVYSIKVNKKVLNDIMKLLSWFNNFTIGGKLSLGFGILVILILAVSGLNFLGSLPATNSIQRTTEVSVPTALASAHAQIDLLATLRNVGSYLALGDSNLRQNYDETLKSFEADLATLDKLSVDFSPANSDRLKQLQTIFAQWSTLPEKLFELRADQLDREPAYRLLATDDTLLAGTILMDTRMFIETQGRYAASEDVVAQTIDMTEFQISFASMFAGLRGYVTTRNRVFRSEYEGNLTLNEFSWERLLSKKNSLTPEQQLILTKIADNRAKFLAFTPQIFDLLETEHWREDLYLFNHEAEPLANQMLALLNEIVTDQQNALQNDLTSGNNLLNTSRQQTAFVGLAAVILGFMIAFVLQRNITRPINSLKAVATTITAGNIMVRAEIRSSDEIGLLAESFNIMTARLQDLIENLEERVQERTQAINQLLMEREETIIKLQELDRLKSEFLTNMSHELRTPLNAILGFSDILLEGLEGELSPEVTNDVRLIYNSGQHLLTIINDMLDISKIEAGMMEIVPEPLDVESVINENFQAMASLLVGKPIELYTDIRPNLPLVYADHIRLRQILFNLVGNAIKFTHQGEVKIKVFGIDDNLLENGVPVPSPQLPYNQICLVIIDTGIGIALAKQVGIFEPFKQADMSKTRIYGGTGLGLAISKELVRLHGGKMGVRSEEGVGSEFWFTLPLAKDEDI